MKIDGNRNQKKFSQLFWNQQHTVRNRNAEKLAENAQKRLEG
jgi:hypothetical protein